MVENTAALKGMEAQLAAVLQVQGGAGMEAWSQLHGKLGHVATLAGNDPRTAGQALLKVAKDASSSEDLMRALEARVSQGNLKYFVFHVARGLNMTPLGDSAPIHMIDADSSFCQEKVDRVINFSAELSDPNTAYAVISIVGAQSSGKSYLLNRLFGTRFPEMNAKLGRSQTTRGIMMSRCIGPSLLLLDVEGSDGIEKGQDTLFEKQATLFALTVSDLMMVNMSVNDIGREDGGGTQIFRTIFQERVKLSQGFTKILFVLRDYDGETPLDVLTKDVQKSLEKIWTRAHKKPLEFEQYIKVHVVALPHKKSPEFAEKVTDLRNLLSNYKGGKVPAPSFSASSRILWDTVKKNKKLDIPSHQETIGRIYCRKLADDNLKSLDSWKDYKILKAEESPSVFRRNSDKLLKSITAKYDAATQKYDRGVRDKERQYLLEKLYVTFADDAKETIWKMKEKTLEQYKGKFDRYIEAMGKKYADAYGEHIVEECKKEFMSSCQDLKVFHSDYLNNISRDLGEKMQSYTTPRIREIKEKHAKKIRRRIRAGAFFVGALTAKLAIFAVTGIPPLY